jgi:hypothetical protein
LTALAAGCTTKQATTYWTQVALLVHHVVGNTDSVEKLIPTQLSAGELKAAALAKGMYFKVVQGQRQVAPTPTARA